MKCFKKHAKVLGMLGMIVLLLCAFSVDPMAFAAETEYEPLTVSVPYKHVYTTTDTSVDDLFHYLVTATDDAPLPAEADENGVFTYHGVSGDGEAVEGGTRYVNEGKLSFTFNKPGVYSYEVKADLDTDNKKEDAEKYTFEPRTYTLNLYIVNAEEGEMKLTMLTAETDEDVKPFEIELDPAYENEQPEPEPEKESHLTVTKTVTSAPENSEAYKEGETVSYSITVKNDGNQTIRNITVTDELTDDSWTVDVLEPDEDKAFTTTYTVTKEDAEKGSVVNVATATGTSDDPDVGDDVPVDDGTVEVPTEPESEPEPEPEKVSHMTVTKTVTSKPANGKAYKEGETVSYSITVKNDGNQVIRKVVVKDDLTGDNWTVDVLEPGAEKTFTTTYKVTKDDAKKGYVVNVATATGTSDDPDTGGDTPVDDGTAKVPVEKPEESPVKTGDENNLMPYGMALVLAGAAILVMLKKKGREDRE